MINWIADVMPLAQAVADDPGLLSSLVYNFYLALRIALGIGLVIFVHELGHFVAAKTFGVKCEKFYVGFDVPLRLGPIKFPRTLGKFKYGETEYGIGVIPLGGYVKMLGQDDDPRKQEEEAKRIQVESEQDLDSETPALDPRSFPAKPVWQRMIIISAGVVMNMITGVIFAAIAFGVGVEYNPAIVGSVTPGGPAWQAGIEPGGQIVSIGDWTDPQMHFLEMRKEILTRGLEQPDQPMTVGIRYADGEKQFTLTTQSSPLQKEARMIGIAIPNAAILGSNPQLVPASSAQAVFSNQDANAEILAFNGIAIDDESIVPAEALLNTIYSHPDQEVTLTLKRTDGSEHTVALPPQKAKTLGLRYQIGPIVNMIQNGPAEQAGMKIGDKILSIAGETNLDPYLAAQKLIGVKGPLVLQVQRGEGDEAETVELTITPSKSAQTLSPTSSIRGEIAVNSVGFAYQPLAIVSKVNSHSPQDATVDATDDSQAETPENPNNDASLQIGDQLQWVELSQEAAEQVASQFDNERIAELLEQLVSRWEISEANPLNDLRDLLQILPDGTALTVAAKRGEDGQIIKSTVQVTTDDLFLFDRGLILGQRQAIQQAGSFAEACSLGLREGGRRFNDVLRFLKMVPQGQIKMKYVGGPLEIVNIAKKETEKGLPRQLMFLTMLSMNLAILNFLPIPALDGGHMVFLIYELVAGKRANETLEFRLTVAGLLALLTFMAIVFANDILRYL